MSEKKPEVWSGNGLMLVDGDPASVQVSTVGALQPRVFHRASYEAGRLAALVEAAAVARSQVAPLRHDSRDVHLASHTTAENIAREIEALMRIYP